jgi:adenylate cyclase
MQDLIAAARSKKLDRITVGYGVAAWALVQAASIAAPTFFWPQWVLRAIIGLALIGLPIALVGGWAIGVRSESGGALKPSRTDLRVLAGLTIFLAIVGPLLTWAFWSRPGPALGIPETAVEAPANSLAVLPFANLSGNPANEYFSDGIAEEVLNDLANRPDLRVAARTSSFAFRGRNADIATIARALHVHAMLEGSVREAGNRVRITAQLINAADGFQLWSGTYDRDLTDILAVQSEIASAITGALVQKILPARRTATKKPLAIDPEAYRLYLQAKDLSHRGNEADLDQAADLLRKTTAKAPEFANGYALLASVLRTLVDRYSKIAFLVPAEDAAREAINLDPANISALNTLTTLLLDQWKWKDALEMFRRTQAASPNNALMLHQRSIIAYTFNYPAEDLAAELKASELDPLQPGIKYGLALWYWNEKRYDEAASAIHRVMQLRQGKFQDADMECLIEASRGHLEEARRIRASIASYYAERAQNPMSCPFMLAFKERDFSAARQMLETAAADAEKNGGSYVNIADNYRILGDLKSAMRWYERAYDARDPLVMFAPYEKYQTADLLSYPPWRALWARPPIQAWEAARVEAGKILGVPGLAKH